jgi:hypothetical protein
MATITKGGTLPDTGVTKNEVYALVDSATISAIVNNDIDINAQIADSKLATITTASKVHQSAISSWLGAIEYVIDGGGNSVTTGIKGYLEVPFACTLTSAKMFFDTSAVARVDIYKDIYANYPPTSADTIISSAGGDTTFSTSGVSATKFSATISNTWTKAVNANDVFGFEVEQNDNATQIIIVLNYVRP